MHKTYQPFSGFMQKCFFFFSKLKNFWKIELSDIKLLQSLDLETKNCFAKKSENSKKKSPLHAKTFWGFMKCFIEFAKRIYETCGCNLFNFALVTAAVFFFNSTAHIDCMFLSCHIHIWVNPKSMIVWMWRNSLLKAGTKSEV